MLLSQGRHWRAALTKAGDAVALSILRDWLAPEQAELRELRIDVPLAKWNSVVKHVLSDRKLLGGVLLGFANQEEQVSVAVASDRLLAELQRVLLEATAALVESDRVSIVASREAGEDE